MDVLCTDKTGTLTTGEVARASWDDPGGSACETVLRQGRPNSRHRTGFKSPLDAALLAAPAKVEADGLEFKLHDRSAEQDYGPAEGSRRPDRQRLILQPLVVSVAVVVIRLVPGRSALI
jgi:magnesium-transporting ATPase (P-type)